MNTCGGIVPKTIAVHQPSYFPWLGYFHKIASVDTFVILDHVQFEKNGFTNRNKILPPDGQPFWLTVPVLTKGKSTQPINEVQINNNENWQEKHFRSISQAYSKTLYWNNYKNHLLDLYNFSFFHLSIYSHLTIKYIMAIMSLETTWKLSSKYSPPIESKKDDLILEICQRERASVYFSGISGKKYLDERKFIKNGIKLVYQDFQHPDYKQHQLKNSQVFVPNMSILDLLFNCGPKSLEMIK